MSALTKRRRSRPFMACAGLVAIKFGLAAAALAFQKPVEALVMALFATYGVIELMRPVRPRPESKPVPMGAVR